MYELPYQSIPEMLKSNAQQYADRIAISYKKGGEYQALSYGNFYERVLMAARGLRKAGMVLGDKVAIFSENCAGWAVSDFAIQCAQGTTVPIYATNTADQAAYVINHSGAKIVFVSNRLQYEKLRTVREQLPNLEQVISFEQFLGSRDLPVYTLSQLSEISHPVSEQERQEIEAGIDAVKSTDLITIIYTSGTTGVPKGVMLTHANVIFDAHYGLEKLEAFGMNETFLSFLPLSHILERTAGYYAPLMTGCHVAFCESPEKVVENMMEVEPTVMVSVPRLFEKIYSRIYEDVHQMSSIRSSIFHTAIATGREYISRRYINPKPLGLLGLKYRFFDWLIFRKIRKRFGGRLEYFLSGGAPLDKVINEFMWVIGIPTFEGYGLTETSPAVTINSPWKVRFGSVGTPLPFTEVKLAEDNELMIRGPQVMRGYYNDPEETERTIKDGWLYTGDIARIDDDGYVYIIDRKKELIITSGGKNIAPQPIENELRMDKYISQAFVYGDRKPYLVAVLTPNLERLINMGQQEGINYLDMEELVANQRVHKRYADRVQALNDKLPSYQTIKKFILLPREFSVEGGELTPTMKLKRKVIYAKYQDRIERLYLHNGNGSDDHPQTENGGES
ncbi:MAG: long-chain fatty acid--CoA ligase [Deltaproteobacteria bacterium]|nr:MAG: long-chain fatty acid--CoA ligase [Deltaproteobacteria bacterium]